MTISARTVLTHERASNVIMAAVFGYFMLSFGADLIIHKRISSFFYMVAESLIVVAFLTRQSPQDLSWRKWDWFMGFIGTITPLLIRPHEAPVEYLWLAIQIFGVTISIGGLLSLNSSFGIVAANRGVKTKGMFAVIRHPVYAGYLIADIAVVAQNWGIENFCLITVHVLAQIARIQAEEKLLMRDEQYRLHAQKVRWRLIPGIW